MGEAALPDLTPLCIKFGTDGGTPLCIKFGTRTPIALGHDLGGSIKLKVVGAAATATFFAGCSSGCSPVGPRLQVEV